MLELLPDPFQEASCWWQATSGAGIKPGIRCRLWFKLSRDIADGEAKGWLAGYPVDSSIFCAVTPHYTAAPILGPGVADPVARRHGSRQGLVDTVEVPDELQAVAPIAREAVVLDGAELSDNAIAALTAAVRASPTVRDIWTGRRTYPDRSRAHLALASALARAGCRDPDVIAAVIPQYAQRAGHDVAKASRSAYLARTISTALELHIMTADIGGIMDEAAAEGDDHDRQHGRRRTNGTGHGRTQSPPPPTVVLTPLDDDRLDWPTYIGRTPPPPPFMVANTIPKRAVTGLFGSDGLGKTLLGQQALTLIGSGNDLFGNYVIERCATLGWFCEEPKEVLAYRQDAINRRLGMSFADLDGHGVEIRARLGKNNLLLRMVDGVCEPTPVFDALRKYCVDSKIKILWLDHLLHLVAGDITRAEDVTKMLAFFSSLAVDIDGAVVLAGHVAKAEGSQYLGSVMFSALVRSRLWLRKLEKEELAGYPVEARPDLRMLELAKANNAGLSQIAIRWQDGTFVAADGSTGVDGRAAHEARAEAVFIRGLRELDQRERSVDNKGVRAAHRMMVNDGLNEGLGEEALLQAMRRLIQSKRVVPSSLKPWRKDRKEVRGLTLVEDARP